MPKHFSALKGVAAPALRSPATAEMLRSPRRQRQARKSSSRSPSQAALFNARRMRGANSLFSEDGDRGPLCRRWRGEITAAAFDEQLGGAVGAATGDDSLEELDGTRPIPA